ncbi:MAG: hypothetical protein HYS55_00090 [Candidatus Omnitrophica bacterium]|nr:hypothetical protein [Candidatus Omnitrophota bacterium]
MAREEVAKERVEFARERDHFEKAFRLIYEEYLAKGYCSANPYQMRFSLFNALPETVTFCLWRKQVLAGTASLISDSALGLPMDDVYKPEMDQLRKEGRKMCEVSLLALNSEVIKKGILPLYFAERLKCLYQIFKPIFWYARNTIEFTDLCIAVNPVHRQLYTSLHFEEFGEERVYESVNGNPSIAMRLRFDNIEERGKITPGLYKLFLGKPLEIQRITDIFRWETDEFRYFFVEHSDLLKKITPLQIQYLEKLYPEIPIKRMVEEAQSKPKYGETSVGKHT